MNKISYANLKLKVNTDVNTFDFNGQTIEVLKYLPISDKYDLVNISLQAAKESEGVYNPVLLDFHFHLNLVYMYSNLSFTEKQRENEEKIYDSLVSNGFMDKFLATIEESEYKELSSYIEGLQMDNINYSTTFASVADKFITDLPSGIEAAKQAVDNFDPEKYQAVIDFAKTANGGRPI